MQPGLQRDIMFSSLTLDGWSCGPWGGPPDPSLGGLARPDLCLDGLEEPGNELPETWRKRARQLNKYFFRRNVDEMSTKYCRHL